MFLNTFTNIALSVTDVHIRHDSSVALVTEEDLELGGACPLVFCVGIAVLVWSQNANDAHGS